MQDLMTKEIIEHVLNSPSQDFSGKSAFHITTMVTADEGAKINGEDVYDIIEEAKRSGVTVASLMHKLPNASTSIMITPGPKVVEQAHRKGGRKKMRSLLFV